MERTEKTMKICVTSEGDGLDSKIDPRFGRCGFFLVIDTGTFEFEVLDNPGQSAQGGAGIKAGQLVSSRQVKAVLTGNIGPNAYEVLAAAGIEVVTGVSGTVKEAVENYNNGKYKAVTDPSVGSKFGMTGK